jgi:hypothetical protein
MRLASPGSSFDASKDLMNKNKLLAVIMSSLIKRY